MRHHTHHPVACHDLCFDIDRDGVTFFHRQLPRQVNVDIDFQHVAHLDHDADPGAACRHCVLSRGIEFFLPRVWQVCHICHRFMVFRGAQAVSLVTGIADKVRASRERLPGRRHVLA